MTTSKQNNYTIVKSIFDESHPKNDNFIVLHCTAMVKDEDITLSEEELREDLFYTDNIYQSTFLKCKGLYILAIQKCQDKRSNRIFTHFWFSDKEEARHCNMNYHQDTMRDNVNASAFVSNLQAIKKILNLAKG